MTPTILLAHAFLPANLRARYEAACPGWRIVPFVSTFPGMSSAYTALAADLRRRYPGPLLDALLRHLKIADAGPVVMAWYSGGYAMARELAVDGAKPAAWVGIDGMHTGKDGDGTASDAGVEWLVRLARAALVGEAAVALGHSDVRTYGTVASTTDVAREVRRLADVPPGDKHGGLVLRAYNVRGPDHDEHVAALTEWGPALLGEAVAMVPLAHGASPPHGAGTHASAQHGGSHVTAAPASPATSPAPRAPTTPADSPSAARPAAAAPRQKNSTLRRGMTGDDVRELQRLLVARGYVVQRDGLFGPATEGAVRDWQEAAGLDVDGVAGPQTMASLRAPAADPYEDTDPGEVIPFVQAKNYYAGRQKPIRLVVLHTAEIAEVGSAAENLATWAAGPNAPMASWHFAVDADSTVQCVREEDTAFAAPGANADGLQVEMAGRAGQGVAGWADPYSQAVLRRTARLVAGLCRRHGLPVAFVDAAGLLRGEKGITTHAAVTAAYKQSTHTDPGKDFDMGAFLDMVRRS